MKLHFYLLALPHQMKKGRKEEKRERRGREAGRENVCVGGKNENELTMGEANNLGLTISFI